MSPTRLFSRSSRTPSVPDNNQLVPVENSPESDSFEAGVRLLHDCPNATVDICFVHGLTGNLYSTWTAPGQTETWPAKLLPPKLKTARILTFGYDAYVVCRLNPSTNVLIDHARNLVNDLATNRADANASSRPLIFVTHSLGGLVCKQALLHSRNNAESYLESIYECTKAVMFMGTPHEGSWIADWAKIPAECLGVFKSTNAKLLDVLQKDDQLLEAIQTEFASLIKKPGKAINVTCFFEELKTNGLLVVRKKSASLTGYPAYSIHATHSGMVKFASKDDSGYIRVQGVLVKWQNEIKKAQQEQQEEKTQGQNSANTSPIPLLFKIIHSVLLEVLRAMAPLTTGRSKIMEREV